MTFDRLIAIKYLSGSIGNQSRTTDQVELTNRVSNRKRAVLLAGQKRSVNQRTDKGANAQSHPADDTRARINRFAKGRTDKRSVKPRDIESSGASRIMIAGPEVSRLRKLSGNELARERELREPLSAPQ